MAIYTHTPIHKSWGTLATVGSTAGPADGPPVDSVCVIYFLLSVLCVGCCCCSYYKLPPLLLSNDNKKFQRIGKTHLIHNEITLLSRNTIIGYTEQKASRMRHLKI